MPDRATNGMQCNEFDSRLTDALDGVLTGVQLDRFQAHARVCRTCGPLLAEAEAGRNWLKGLTEVEPPANLVANILASTTGVDTQRLWKPAPSRQPRTSWLEHVEASFLEPLWATVRQPRFAMSFGMAFFALSVGLSALGVKPSDLRQISLRPAAIRHTYNNAEGRVIRYYDNIRLVYQLQAAASKLKRNVTPAERPSDESAPAKPKDLKNDTTEQPDQKQERNYSQTQDQVILAAAPVCVDGRQCWVCGQECPRHTEGPSVVYSLNQDLPVVSVTTYRRLV